MGKIVEIIKAVNEPTTKLIEVISRGIGTLYEPHKIKKLADAEAYKIKTISQAISENGDLPIEYSDNNLNINSKDYGELQRRAMYRFARLETQRQFNIENIADKAYDLLKNMNLTSSEEVSYDWIVRFISSAQDVSEEMMQELWSKVLAGEILHPKSFSLKTLDILKNMSQSDAIRFEKACSLVIDKGFIPNDIDLISKYGITYADILQLDESSLINSSSMITWVITIDSDKERVFKCDDYVCFARGIGEIELEIFKLTNSASELLSIISHKINEEFLMEYTKKIREENSAILITLHKIASIDDEVEQYDEQDLLAEE